MSWQQIKFKVRESLTEIASELLENCGAVSVTFQDAEDIPVFEPLPGETPLWLMVEVTGLFRAEVDLEPVFNVLESSLPEESLESLLSADLEEQNWSRTWLKYFKPLKFGKSLWIIPDGFEVQDPQACNILLDPGLAFGTGTHPTTALCLGWLDSVDVTDKTVIDYGCGSGILALAASLLGAQSILATDIDPQALTATHQNALKNKVLNITTEISTSDMVLASVDLLLANILAGPLCELASSFAAKTKSGGQIVLSGLLENQIETVVKYYSDYFQMDTPRLQDGWVCLTGTRL